MAGGYVQKGDFVGTLFVVARGNLHGIPGIADINEVDAFDNPTLVDVKAGNNTLGE